MKRDLYDEARRYVAARDIAHGYDVAKYCETPRPGVRLRVEPSAIPDWFKPLTAADHVAHAVTYEWKCRTCGDSAYLPFSGGPITFESCECDHSRNTGLDIFWILNGKRTFESRIEDIGIAREAA